MDQRFGDIFDNSLRPVTRPHNVDGLNVRQFADHVVQTVGVPIQIQVKVFYAILGKLEVRSPCLYDTKWTGAARGIRIEFPSASLARMAIGSVAHITKDVITVREVG